MVPGAQLLDRAVQGERFYSTAEPCPRWVRAVHSQSPEEYYNGGPPIGKAVPKGRNGRMIPAARFEKSYSYTIPNWFPHQEPPPPGKAAELESVETQNPLILHCRI